MTPCEKCRAERDSLRKREAELQAALLEAISRLNDFLAAFEGAPDPSENETKHLVTRLFGVLDG